MNSNLAYLNLADAVLPGRTASAEFEEVGREVISLHTAVKELEEEAANPDSILSRSDERKKKELAIILPLCRTALSQLEGLLAKYKSLGTKHKKAWDAIRMGSEGLADARSKIYLSHQCHQPLHDHDIVNLLCLLSRLPLKLF